MQDGCKLHMVRRHKNKNCLEYIITKGLAFGFVFFRVSVAGSVYINYHPLFMEQRSATCSSSSLHLTKMEKHTLRMWNHKKQTEWENAGFIPLAWRIYHNVHCFPMIMNFTISKLNWLPDSSKDIQCRPALQHTVFTYSLYH